MVTARRPSVYRGTSITARDRGPEPRLLTDSQLARLGKADEKASIQGEQPIHEELFNLKEDPKEQGEFGK